jgi:hypothetical protein
LNESVIELAQHNISLKNKLYTTMRLLADIEAQAEPIHGRDSVVEYVFSANLYDEICKLLNGAKHQREGGKSDAGAIFNGNASAHSH